jgi:hypothetical protein
VNGKIKKFKAPSGEYAYPVTVGRAVYIDPSTTLLDKFEQLRQEKGQYLSSYVIDLDRWNITPNTTDNSDIVIATDNSNGINRAIQWASQQGYVEVVFPKNFYLISEYISIVPASNMKLNLNGAHIRVRNNGVLAYYAINLDQRQENVWITNGIIEGERFDHDYSATGDHCAFGIRIYDCNNVVIDNMDVYYITGDAIGGVISPGWVNGYDLSTFETGGINTSNGTLQTDNNRQRLVNPIDLSKYPTIADRGYFAIEGNSWQDLGGDIHTDTFDVVFYDKDSKFVSSIPNVNFWDLITPPANAKFFKIALIQTQPVTPGGSALTLGATIFASYVYLENNHFHHCRRCGISNPSKYWYIRDNEIHDIGDIRLSDGTIAYGAAPRAIIDIEDGYGMNQYIWFENNICYNALVSVSPVGTRNLVVRGNWMNRAGIFTVWDECLRVNISDNFFLNSTYLDIRGEAVLKGNTFYRGNCNIHDSSATSLDIGVTVSSNLFHNSGLSLAKSVAYRVTATDNNFYTDMEGSISGSASLSCSGAPQNISNSNFYASGCSFDDNSGTWVLKGLTFKDLGNTTIKLPSGIVDDCIFDNANSLRFVGNVGGTNYRTEFRNCYFTDTKGTNLLNQYLMGTIVFKNCRFLWKTNVPIFYFIHNTQGDVRLLDSYIEYSGITASNFNVFSLWVTDFQAKQLVIKGNEFVANMPIMVMNLSNLMPGTKYVFQENTLTGMTQTFTNVDDLTTGGNIINGVQDPWKIVTDPTTITQKFPLGYKLTNANPIPGGNAEWICTTAGYIASGPWQPSKTFGNKSRIVAAGHVYECMSSNITGTIQPNFTGKTGEIVIDNPALPSTWKPLTQYSVGDRVIATAPITYNGSSANFLFYRQCTTAGTSGSTEPSWNGSFSATTTETSGVAWKNYAMAAWAEIGAIAVFKKLGTIEA